MSSSSSNNGSDHNSRASQINQMKNIVTMSSSISRDPSKNVYLAYCVRTPDSSPVRNDLVIKSDTIRLTNKKGETSIYKKVLFDKKTLSDE